MKKQHFLRNSLGSRLFTALVALGATTAIALHAPVIQAQTGGSAANEPRPGEKSDDAAYRLNEEGKKLVAAGKYEDALEKFRASVKLFPLSNAIFNIGSMLYTLKQYDEAYPYLQETLRAPLNPEQREIALRSIENVVNQLKLSHAPAMIETSPPGAMVAINNKELPFPTPMRMLVPFGTIDITLSSQGFKPQTVVVTSSRADMPKDMRVRLERDEPDAPVTVFCPKGADIFIDGQMHGFEQARTRLLIGPHVVRCGKTQTSKAFERSVNVRPGPNAFEFSTATH